MKTASLLLLTLVFAFSGFALETAAPAGDGDAFARGLVLLQTQKFAEAQAQFETALNTEPQNAHILFNLGLAYYRQDKKGWAAACWRKALSIRPDLDAAKKSLAVLSHELPVANSNADESGWFSQLQHEAAGGIGWPVYLLSLWLLLVGAGFLWLRYLGQRKKALLLEEPAPALPNPALALTAMFVLLSFLMLLKLMDSFQARATAVSETAVMRLSPDAAAPQLSEILQGQEVDLVRTHQDWAQVVLASGMTGWVPQKNLFQTTGRPLW